MFFFGPSENLPPGFRLCGRLQKHDGPIGRIAWSPDGRFLASAGVTDLTVVVWEAEKSTEHVVFAGHTKGVFCVAWSPDGRRLASGSSDRCIRVWNAVEGHQDEAIDPRDPEWGEVYSVSWSPAGDELTAGSFKRILSWNTKPYFQEAWRRELLRGNAYGLAHSADGARLGIGCGPFVWLYPIPSDLASPSLDGHRDQVLSIAWSPDSRMLASGSKDNTIRIWDPKSRRQTAILEGHTGDVTSLSFSLDGRLLASKSSDDTVRLWRCDTWETVARLPEASSGSWGAGLAFHPIAPNTLATLGEKDTIIRIWDLDLSILLGDAPPERKGRRTKGMIEIPIDSVHLASIDETAVRAHPPATTRSDSFSLVGGLKADDHPDETGECTSEMTPRLHEVKQPFTVEDAVASATAAMVKENFRQWAKPATRATLAIVFADIDESLETNLRLGDETWAVACRAFFNRARESISRYGGFEIDIRGDAALAAFPTAIQALKFSFCLRRKTGDERVQIKAGIHVGPVRVDEIELSQSTIAIARRIAGLSGPNEIWASGRAKEDVVSELGQENSTVTWNEHTDCKVKGIPDGLTLWSLEEP